MKEKTKGELLAEIWELRRQLEELKKVEIEQKEIERALNYRLETEKMVMDISNRFISISFSEIDKEINHSLEIIGKYVEADRCYVYFFTQDLTGIKKGYEWCDRGVAPGLETVCNMNFTDFSWTIEKLKNLEILYLPSIAEIPPEAEKEKREFWETFGIKSFLSIPLSLDKKLTGFLGFHTVKKDKVWSYEDIGLLKMAGEIFIYALERKEADKALKERGEEKYRRIFYNIRDIYYEVTMDGIILEVSPSIEEFSKYKTEDLLGKSLYEIYVNPEDRVRVIEEIKKRGKVTDYEITLKDKDGSHVFCSINSMLIMDNHKKPLKIAGSIRTINERKQAEEVLKNRFLMEKLVSDVSTRFININPLEVDREIKWALQAIGEFVKVDRSYVYLLSDDLKKIQYGYEWCAEGIESRLEYIKGLTINPDSWLIKLCEKFNYIQIPGVKDLSSGDSSVKKIWDILDIKSLLGIPLYTGKILIGFFGFSSVRTEKIWKDEDIRLIRLVGDIFVNILDRRRMEEEKEKMLAELVKTQKMEALGVLAGGIAHDFNNILASIMGYTEMSMKYLSEGSTVFYNLQCALKSINRATDLVKQILTYSRQSEEELKPVNLSPIVREVIKFIRSTIPSTIEIKKNIKLNPAMIMGNSTQVYQVMINLCTNAYQAMRDNTGLLEIILSAIEIEDNQDYPDLSPGSYIRLSVRDTGHGIDDKIINKIFDPFFTTKKRGKGTGMGLSVVHGIVKNHGGAISVFSEPEKGTTFEVLFPRIYDKDIEEAETFKEIERGNESILIVDDEIDIVDLMCKMLSGFGYRVTGTYSSTEALEIFKNNPQQFDLVITDLTMPDMTGIELTGKILNIRSEMPVILCTGYDDKISPEEAGEKGFRNILMKPVYMKDLTDTIRNTLAVPSSDK